MQQQQQMRAPAVGALEEIQISADVESAILRMIAAGADTRRLSDGDRAGVVKSLCESLRLNPLTGPIQFIVLNGKEVPYVTRGATDQLAARHKLNREIIDGPKVIDLAGTKLVYAVCRATHPDGRTETSTATVPLTDPLNVLMKCETKAKRRATLSILGLGALDEMELDTIPRDVMGDRATPPTVSPRSSSDGADEGSADGAEGEEPSSHAWTRFVDVIAKAATLVEIVTAYSDLLSGLQEEGADLEHWTQGTNGAGARAFARMDALGHRLSTAERSQVLRGPELAAVLDAQSTITAGNGAVQAAARWWVSQRTMVAALPQEHRKTPWYALVRRYAAATSAVDTKRAGAALEAAVKLLDKTPPDGPGHGTSASAPSGAGAEAMAGAQADGGGGDVSPRAMLDGYRAHLAAIPDRGEDRGAARIAGGYWKRREDFASAGVRAEALGLVVDELTARGVAEPHTWLTEIGERNGYVTRTRKVA